MTGHPPDAGQADATDPADQLDLPSFDGRTSLRQQVGDALRALLISGRMRPGVLYSAPKLAARFGVSATPVREAMLDLVGEGLVEVVRNKGFRVTGMTGHELDCLAELRAMIEIPAMAAVAEECTGAVAEAVEALRPRARAICASARRKDLVGYLEADTRFHLDFLALHGNDHLVEVVRDLRSRSRLYGLDALADAGTLGDLAGDHEEMVDVALARRPERMREVMSRHIGLVRSTWAGDAG
ncbi:GntR family transcriptional regulator [Spelaeicoccus albus]|uniref:DNA-binding GntR family transcriptional regulator n=1 Tax=Spelaeicoccus albus TaxID=1280376 RepID=A0A7Z0IHE5_9MICO|nr:GntR family transcriptional regulator [Spelaeicoccus albus]NYI67685.1 DNA-binding GntR family transcriptional regulator [Spelaeicoccus albus]